MSATGKGPPPLWRDAGERAGFGPSGADRSDEFPGLAEGLAAGFDRRTAMKLAGAAMALGGLVSCDQPEEEILPYVDQPEGLVPGVPRFYATTLLSEGYGIGALVESHEGRPTKVEGNPAHPASLGATDAVMQAACLDLFDPQRSRLPLRDGQAASLAAVDLMLAALRERLQATGGEALAVLTGPSTSPSFNAAMGRLRSEFPGMRWYRHEPLGSAAVDICGQRLLLRPRLAEAKVIVSLDADFLAEGPGKLAHARGFAARRSVAAAQGAVAPGAAEMNRLYAVETTPTITGAMADHHWSIRPSELAAVARALAALLAGADGPEAPVPSNALQAMAEDLRRAGPEALILPEPHLAPEVQRLALAMNDALGAMGRTLEALPQDAFAPAVDGDLAGFVADLAERRGTALLLETNPVYTAPGDLDVAGALAEAELAVHLGGHVDETAVLCDWHVPAAHPLESWGDARAFDGTASPIQPLIRPLYGGRTPAQVVAALLGSPKASARDLVAGHWQERGLSQLDWRLALQRGVFEGPDVQPLAPQCGTVAAALRALPPEAASPGLELRFTPDPFLRDGKYATNAWLQELPRPLTKIVWGNVAAVAPGTARALGIESEALVQLGASGESVVIPAFVQPGHPEGVVTVALGHGRWEAGEEEHRRGVSVFPLRRHGALWSRPVELEPLGATETVVTTQHHHSMEGRHPVRHATLHAYRESHDVIHKGHPPPPEHSLYPEWEYPDQAWGMVIDQTVCIGCNACVAACQAENNIPTVGPEQCAMGREMHWLRVDRYYAGPEDEPHTYFQPVPCMHCEKAPCEVVCPVNATVHTHDGLNAQVYNRCIGTRYCSQNCPYKVRRFNFLSYQPFDQGREAPTAPVMNPDVSVRSRGVMEKCTYCVQRISAARIQADIERRPVAEGEVVTACQQACPTQAIRFGDLNEPGSTVRHFRDHPLNYALLAHLNTRPRTTYLGRLSNPHPALHGQPGDEEDD